MGSFFSKLLNSKNVNQTLTIGTLISRLEQIDNQSQSIIESISIECRTDVNISLTEGMGARGFR